MKQDEKPQIMDDWLYRDGSQEKEIAMLGDLLFSDSDGIDKRLKRAQKIITQLKMRDKYMRIEGEVRAIPSGLSCGILLSHGVHKAKKIIYTAGLREGSPLLDHGIQYGDILISVNGCSVQGFTRNKVAKLLGSSGVNCTLEFYRALTAQTMEVQIERKECGNYLLKKQIPGIEYIGLISLEHAYLYDQFNGGIMLDLRGNMGGNMGIAEVFLEQFLPIGQTLFQTKTTTNITKHSSKGGKLQDNPLVILTDNSTGSAAEMIACAIQSHERGVVVGNKSFGKGVQQKRIQVGDGLFLYYTNGQIIGPNNEDWDKKGINPNIKIPKKTSIIIEGKDMPYIVAMKLLRMQLK